MTGAAAVEAAVKLLDDPDPRSRWNGAIVLGQAGAAARGAVPRLAEALKDPDVATRFNAAAALGRIGPDASEAAPALLKALEDANVSVRQNALTALGSIKPDGKAVTAAMAERLKDPDLATRAAAAEALRRVDRTNKDALARAARAAQGEKNPGAVAIGTAALGRMREDAGGYGAGAGGAADGHRPGVLLLEQPEQHGPARPGWSGPPGGAPRRPRRAWPGRDP